MSFLIIMVLLLVVMYVLMIRPQRQRQQKQQAMIEGANVGDDVLTVRLNEKTHASESLIKLSKRWQ